MCIHSDLGPPEDRDMKRVQEIFEPLFEPEETVLHPEEVNKLIVKLLDMDEFPSSDDADFQKLKELMEKEKDYKF